MYADNDHKFVAVLNKKVDIPQLMNALGHISAGLASLCEDSGIMRFLQYVDADGELHPAISHYPFIVLSADNSNQIRTLRRAAIEREIIFNDFADTMVGISAEGQLRKTKNTSEKDLNYIGICLFGHSDVVSEITRKFSLLRS